MLIPRIALCRDQSLKILKECYKLEKRCDSDFIRINRKKKKLHVTD